MPTHLPDITEDIELLKKLREGDQLAFAQIYNLYRSKIYLYACNLCKSAETAEEVVQEVFIRIWQKKDQINPELNFDAYIRKITLNHVLNHLKKIARDKVLQEEVLNYMDAIRHSTDDSLLEKELLKTYDEAIALLPAQKKLIYQMSRNEEMTHEQIAERLNISKNTVKNHMVVATKFIRSYVSKHGSIVCFLIASNYFRSN
ncbi:RNA polymerase sigma factor [Pedobacter panaciterrae]|jgi:RNA polymerase sigma-70 factor, Bacteroides expansion family 1|uniref:RNA polymerase sigma factor n=1 Tax=Pedobacter panaciterrae TaxID=363849 RepID=A0ABU8NGX6_9SPHI|nr:RNA polymerase sigma-70 factor [Pedobacter panaciterrae]NQX56765.1 RNA polymerase sigma-70 factor [Pedobacter panaciterrae]